MVKIQYCHTTAVFRCSQCGETVHRYSGTSFNVIDVVAAFLAAIIFCVRMLMKPWDLPFYYCFGILAGEFLLFYAAGFMISLLSLFIPQARPSHAISNCKGVFMLSGRFFKKTEVARWTDYGILFLFVLLNIGIWINLGKLLRG
jgi:hypothetical protein